MGTKTRLGEKNLQCYFVICYQLNQSSPFDLCDTRTCQHTCDWFDVCEKYHAPFLFVILIVSLILQKLSNKNRQKSIDVLEFLKQLSYFELRFLCLKLLLFVPSFRHFGYLSKIIKITEVGFNNLYVGPDLCRR